MATSIALSFQAGFRPRSRDSELRYCSLIAANPTSKKANTQESPKNAPVSSPSKGQAGPPSRGEKNMVQLFLAILYENREHLIAGGIARGVSNFIMHPVDCIKTRLQSSTEKGAKAAQQIITKFLTSGNIFPGVGSALVGQIPYGMLTFGTYQVYKQMLTESFPELSERVKIIIAASLGDLTGSLWLCPAEVVKQSIQIGSQPNAAVAVSSILSKSGPWGLYRGYAGQISRDVPFRVIQLSLYEEVKKLYSKLFAKGRDLASKDNMIIGAITGSITAGVTAPLDVIKTRMMTDQTGQYKSVLDVIVKGMKAEGPGFLFRGAVPRVLYITPSVAIFFTVYEAYLKFVRSRAANAKKIAATPSNASTTKGAAFIPLRPMRA